jgi:hypothetical protein
VGEDGVMSLKERLTRRVHNVLCQTNKVPQADWGCCGCGAPEMDAYLTVGCDYCKAPGEGYCWKCIDEPDWPERIRLVDFTVVPGRERAS